MNVGPALARTPRCRVGERERRIKKENSAFADVGGGGKKGKKGKKRGVVPPLHAPKLPIEGENQRGFFGASSNGERGDKKKKKEGKERIPAACRHCRSVLSRGREKA